MAGIMAAAEKLSGGQIAGFVIGGIAVILLAVGIIYWGYTIYKEKMYGDHAIKNNSVWAKHGHWFVIPVGVMILIVGLALVLAPAFVNMGVDPLPSDQTMLIASLL